MKNKTRLGEQDTQEANTRTTIKVIEDEVLELEEEKRVLLTRLTFLDDSICHKRALAASLKNSLAPVHCLPSEVLLACFTQAVQDWVTENDEADIRMMREELYSADRELRGSEWPCSPVFAISHVSRHWRQLTIHMPTLWTNLVITPKFERHLGVFRDHIHRANGMSITAKFQSFGSENKASSAGFSLMKATMPLIHAEQVTTLSLVNAGPVYFCLLAQLEEIIRPPKSFSSTAFNHLTKLSILFPTYNWVDFKFTSLMQLLSMTPQLKTLEVQHKAMVDSEELTENAIIDLPKLESLTVIHCNIFTSTLLDSLSAPNVHHLKLLQWDTQNEIDLGYLFIDFDLKVPRFPDVQDLTISLCWMEDDLDANLISAFPRVTHFTMCGLSPFIEDPPSLATPTFQQLQHFTLDFRHADMHLDPQDYFPWLRRPEGRDGRVDHPVLISVLNPIDPALRPPDKLLFRYYKELQQYGMLDGRSSRLNKFLRWQADGEPELV
ncbi:hypothetical protein BJ138DRAFT_1128705 [Hygrophoropsis aurantiaca]|uniref:Uncharacterized protein n=1 Tax=Hygrophoropsis aurantiaca TaxID=72124 RepID=A0ACB8A3Z8_9AGAM|nr:hypothetical protein BJ138DRAFT_1128705 [Hygrophoropsis aurantiaca]